jgi:hypothetical protein
MKPLALILSIALSTATICLADFKEYQGKIGDKNVTFLLAWGKAGDVTGKCILENDNALPIEGRNYAEGQLRLNFGEGSKSIGIITLTKENANGLIVWSGIAEFNDASRLRKRNRNYLQSQTKLLKPLKRPSATITVQLPNEMNLQCKVFLLTV